MKMKNGDKVYLKKASLAGYKSIINLDVEFINGLNIIIGKNASGKTNFLTFLSKVLDFSYQDLFKFTSSLSFGNGKEFRVEAKSIIDANFIVNPQDIKLGEVTSKLWVDDRLIPAHEEDKETGISNMLKRQDINFQSIFVRHGVPENFYLVDAPYSFQTDSSGFPIESIKHISDFRIPFFIKSLLLKFIFSSMGNKEFEKRKINFRENLLDAFTSIDIIKSLLHKYSPIEDVRFNENFNTHFDDDKKELTVNNIFIEFKVAGTWLPYSSLSDGTQRLFYIIAEVGYSENFYISEFGFGFGGKERDKIILIEAPELGIHPHQLMKLMDFLKEQSKKKQIIVSTHSPQILNVLGKEELNRIFISYYDSPKTGTKIRSLNQGEISKAQLYMEEDYLSDYWQYSDLEK